MALPVSGQLTLHQIAYELGYPLTNISLQNMGYNEGLTAPYHVSDFYGLG